jgi:hypothetical protein
MGVIAVLLVVSAGVNLHRGNVPAVRSTITPAALLPVVPPGTKPPDGVIRGARFLAYGETLRMSGYSVALPGTVRLLGRWNSQPWKTFGVADADGRPYHFAFRLNHRGTLRLRVIQPDGSASVGVYRVDDSGEHRA